ncbi:hypothetical protein ACQWU4_18840 [Chryseobacterium sp. MIQD13]|uniref:hypothetical protein n=1 Tax=Chryseobacterium sp. MIQD13 TaxID=3422310 RepID=UPI003D29F203
MIFLINSCCLYSQVGISTSNPSAMLDIVSIGNTPKALKVSNTNKEIASILNNGNLGINVSNPSAQLHTSGSIRLSGLGINTADTKIVTSDTNGNITTRSTTLLLPQILAGANGIDAISATLSVSSVAGIASYTSNLLIRSFTLTQTSMVSFSYQLSVGSITNTTGGNLTDGASKQIGARLAWKSLPAGSPFTLSDTLYTDAMPFMNSSANYTKGFYYPKGNCSLILSPGAYSVELKGYVYAYDNLQGIKATFGGSPYDRLDIIATPVQ